jgi:geranylgeranyl pyrophosphate synthase
VLKSAARRAGEDDAAPSIDTQPVLDLVARHRGVADTVRRAEEHVNRARAALAPFPDGGAKDDMIAAARFAADRDR